VFVFFLSSRLLPRPDFAAGAIDALLFWPGFEELVAAFFFFSMMLSPNPFLIAGSEPTVAFDCENTFEDSVFGCACPAAGLDNGVGDAVTLIPGMIVLLPGVDAIADLAAEDDGTWEDLSCDGCSASFFSPPNFVAGGLEDSFCGLGCGANCFVFSIIVFQIEEVLVDSCFIFVSNDIRAPSLDVTNGVNKGKVRL
jgi:hypothetical protein